MVCHELANMDSTLLYSKITDILLHYFPVILLVHSRMITFIQTRFFEKYQDRLLYGTDMGPGPEMYGITFRILETNDEHFYETGLFGYHWPLYGFGLKDTVLKKIYSENAKKILKR